MSRQMNIRKKKLRSEGSDIMEAFKKLLAITLENATNNDTFVRELAFKLWEDEYIEWNSEHLRFYCFRYILNLAAQTALDQIKEDNKLKIRELNLAIRTSPQRFDATSNILNLFWIAPPEIAEFLEPFKDLTTKMLSISYCTASWIIPLFNIILNHVEDVDSNAETETPLSAAAMAAREKLVQYYFKTNTTVTLCTALDPRRKFHYLLKKEFPNDEINETKALYLSDSKFSSTNTNIKSTMRSLLDADFDEADENFDELECYISEKPANKEIDVLVWWK
ncbi:20657_t:CDS:2, partial [Gigaspora margarita]